MRSWILKWLGLERHNDRLIALERHFVTQHDPKTGQPTETLADRQAAIDGRPAPKPLAPSRQWNQRKRILEFEDQKRAEAILHGKRAN